MRFTAVRARLWRLRRADRGRRWSEHRLLRWGGAAHRPSVLGLRIPEPGRRQRGVLVLGARRRRAGRLLDTGLVLGAGSVLTARLILGTGSVLRARLILGTRSGGHPLLVAGPGGNASPGAGRRTAGGGRLPVHRNHLRRLAVGPGGRARPFPARSRVRLLCQEGAHHRRVGILRNRRDDTCDRVLILSVLNCAARGVASRSPRHRVVAVSSQSGIRQAHRTGQAQIQRAFRAGRVLKTQPRSASCAEHRPQHPSSCSRAFPRARTPGAIGWAHAFQ